MTEPATEVNGTLNRFAGLLREAPPWLSPICDPGRDWKVVEVVDREYVTTLNAFMVGSEMTAADDSKEGLGRYSRVTALYDATVRAAERAGRIKSFDKAQRVLHSKAYWDTNNRGPNRSVWAKCLSAPSLLSDGSILLRAHLANDVEVLAGLIALKDVDFSGKKEYMEYAIRRVEPWLKGFGVGGYSQKGTYAFYAKWSEQEKSAWLEAHEGYMDRLDAFFAELRSSCSNGDEGVPETALTCTPY